MARINGITEISLDEITYKISRSDEMTGDRILHTIEGTDQGIIEALYEDEDSDCELVDLCTVDASEILEDEEEEIPYVGH